MAALEGRVALITGGARGIGRAIAEALLREGAQVTLADNGASIDGQEVDASVAGATAAELGPNAAGVAADVSTPEGAQKAVEAACEAFGGLDIVANNAAILRDGFVFKARPEDFDTVLRTNLNAAFYVLNAATPLLREQAKAGRGGEAGWGRILNITSSAGFFGNFGQSAYAAAKAGLFGLTRVAALDMGRSKVTANAIAPFARTRVTDIIQPANDAQASYKERALKIDADHVGRWAAFLASDRAAGITGQLFVVRGRETILMSQPRPAATAVAPEGGWTIDTAEEAVRQSFAENFTGSETDLEAFNTEPVI